MPHLVHDQAQRQAEASIQVGAPAPDSTAVPERIARSAVLAQHLAQPRPMRRAAGEDRARVRKRVIRAVADATGHRPKP